MQNNPEKKSGSFGKMMKEKGYYIVLFLCIIAVGISGYIFVKTAHDQKQAAAASEALSVPLTTQTEKAANSAADASVSASADSAEAAAMTDSNDAQAASAEPAAVTTVAPLSGESVNSYSMDALAYNATMRDWRTHDGVDITAEEGTNVVAARDGTVTAVYDDDALGRVVTISHDAGYVTTYASLSEETSVLVGDTVKAGDTIGTVGNTAKLELSEGPHLHFAVSCNGSPVDPATFLG